MTRYRREAAGSERGIGNKDQPGDDRAVRYRELFPTRHPDPVNTGNHQWPRSTFLRQVQCPAVSSVRCCQIQKGSALLYLGGGFTKDSIPNLEWEETENKSRTLLDVMGKI